MLTTITLVTALMLDWLFGEPGHYHPLAAIRFGLPAKQDITRAQTLRVEVEGKYR